MFFLSDLSLCPGTIPDAALLHSIKRALESIQILGGGGVLPYTSYIGLSHPTGSGFGLKTGIYFAYFGLELGMVFKGTMGVYEHTYCFNSKRIRKK